MSAATWESKRGGPGAVWVCARENFGLWFRNWVMLGPGWLLNLVGTAVGIATYFLMARYEGGAASAALRAYGGNLGAYVVLGMICSGFLAASLRTFHQALCEGFWSSQFELFNTQPGGVTGYFLGSVARQYAMELLNGAINVLVGVALFGLRLQAGSLVPGLAVVLLAGLAVCGLGMLAGCTFVFLGAKQWGDPLSWLLGLAGSLVAGVYFPPTLLPVWAQRLGALLPQTYAYDAARRILLAGAGWADPHVHADVLVLAGVAVVGVPVGAALLAWSIRAGERIGAFTRWN